ncbi:hypothetical protein HDU97_009546 [Phlyctochytrium planicorne]|nr:hypothetical protein HDU97_009546 [Phlyctochytrium planicorne]
MSAFFIKSEDDGNARLDRVDPGDSALFSSFVDFGDIGLDSGIETPQLTAVASPVASGAGSSPIPSQAGFSDVESKGEAAAFLSPPQSNFSPTLDASTKLFPPSPAEPLLQGFCPPSDLMMDSADLDRGQLGATLPAPAMPWLQSVIPPPLTANLITPPPKELLKLLRSDTANACQQLLSEPVRRKPGRKKKSEIEQQKLQQQQQQTMMAIKTSSSPSASPPPLQVKSESDSEPTTHSTTTQPLQPSSTPVQVGLTKRQERMVKNREAADQSRKRKREHLQTLESHAQALISENDELRARVIELEHINMKLNQENISLRSALSSLDPNSIAAAGAPLGFGTAGSLSIPLPADGMLDGTAKKKARKDVFLGADPIPAKPLGAVFMGGTKRQYQDGLSTCPRFCMLTSSKVFDDRSQLPQIEGSPLPLLLPGMPRDLIVASQVTTDLATMSASSFVITSSKSLTSPPLVDALKSTSNIPLTNLNEVLDTMTSAESGLTDAAKIRITRLRKLFADGGFEQDTTGVLRRVGPHILPVERDLLPPSNEELDGGFPAAVESYLASLRSQEAAIVLPATDKDTLNPPNSIISAQETQRAEIYPSRFCPNRRRDGPMLSLVANLPTKKTEFAASRGSKDPLEWQEGDLKQEFERWITLVHGTRDGDDTRSVGRGGAFLQFDVEVVGARLVTTL